MNVKLSSKIVGIIVLFTMWISQNEIYAISENFKFVIDTIGIPRYNVYGKEINEEIYKAYNVFSYGTPEELGSDLGQRWKNSKYGLWAKGLGAYCGNGIRGEYNLLGKDYSGNVINNYYFPVDVLPTNTPEYWEYYSNPGALESWKDTNKYKYVEQLEYMKNTKLLFNDISSRDNSDNPEKIKEYNITASKIGLDKARLDVSSTWKTNGIIHARRKVDNSIRYAVFLTNPMSANASIKNQLEVKQKFWVMSSNQDSISMSIKHGANIVNMEGYANPNHVKEIVSKLYVNGKLVDEISGGKTDTLGKKYMLKLTRDDLIENEENVIKIVNECYAYTEFAVDGLMQDVGKQNIMVRVKEKEIIPFQIDEVKVLEKQQESLVVSPLAQSNITEEESSLGITEAGKYLAMKLDINNKINSEELDNLEVYFNNEKIENIEKIYSQENNNVCVSFRIPIHSGSSVFGWKSLRQLYGNYFGIEESQIGRRINPPHEITIKAKYNSKETSKSFKIDTIDDYVTNINYRYSNGYYNNKGILKLEDWLLNE